MPATATSGMGETATATGESVAVRMYRGILGDFFVLTHRSGDRKYRALIDCGALQCIAAAGGKPETASSLARLETAIVDLLAEGAHFDLVIATHEHYDHLGGFMKYHRHFIEAGFSIDRLWLAWTEDDNDSLATDIRAGRSKGIATLNALVASVASANEFGVKLADDETRGRIDELRNLLQFNGDPDPDSLDRFAARTRPGSSALAAAKPVEDPGPKPLRLPPRSCRDAFDWLKSVAGKDQVSYLHPGQQVSFGLDDRLQASVLGPPRARARLLQMDPSKDPGAEEAYLTASDPYAALTGRLEANMTARQQKRAAAVAGGQAAAEAIPDDVEVFVPADTAQPFDDRYNHQPEWKLDWEKDKAGKGDRPKDVPSTVDPKFFDDIVVRSKCPIAKLYYHPRNASRRIDGDWLGLAQTLALKIDGDVNNTSLALAIEVPGRHVLLFPADAQIGNWLSWHDQRYPSEPKKNSGPGGIAEKSEAATGTVDAEKGETVADILGRVVLYKVGHHGSHNATARAQGLELMTSPHLAALIPVVEDVAKEQKTSSNPKGWAMPYGDLFSRLITKTSGRIVRGDGDRAAEAAAFSGGEFNLTYADESADPLWVALSLAVSD
jgi:hypothetical protein